jgi:hypothetical protein
VTGAALLALAAGVNPSTLAAGSLTGEQIFRQRCAKCHGAKGEGTDDGYPQPLAGDRSVAQLARLIARTMPKDAKEKCVGEDAQKVAAYIYEAFYSKSARARNLPARIELSRLTVRQYRNAVADLIGSFRAPARWDNQRGLQAVYFKSFGIRNKNRVFERIDRTVRFDFGEASPDAEKIEPDRFSIRWEGSVLAPETGEYEFIVRTEHAARLWLNDGKRPLIDAWVKSGKGDAEHRGSITLLGGRAYPLRLEFSKGKQGVPDNKKKEAKPPPTKASITLEWKPPQRAAEVIPEKNLSPHSFPETLVVSAAFPPDDRSVGYERGTSVSKAWDQATTDAALEVAAYVVSHLAELVGVREDAPDRGPRLREFCKQFAERAFRRPLTEEQQNLFITRQFERTRDLETAVKRVVLLALKSPRFLYRELGGDAYDVASRISFGLWDSLPDRDLLAAAAAGRLATHDQVARQVARMMSDLRARSKIRAFLLQWLKIDPAPELSKAKERFPGFDQAAASDLRTSLDLFLEEVVWSEASDFRQLFLADYLYLNARLARFYDANLPADAPFQKVCPTPKERAGILTHPYLMATFAYTATTSPIHRGVFLARNVLGVALPPPPEAFTPLAADLHPELTTRERIALQTRPQACYACHAVINPLGFTLEHFDAIGRFRGQESGRPIDATGTYQTRAGAVVKFNGVRDLATFLTGAAEAQEAFIRQLFHYLVKQPIRAYGRAELAELRQFFVAHNCSIRKLIVEIIATSSLTPRDNKVSASAVH